MAMKAKELAQLMGVSAATMSLVLNNKPGISSDLRSTLLQQVRDLGYGHMIKGENEDAEGELFHKKIAYLIYPGKESGSDGNSFYAPVLEGVEREARRLGYQLMVVHMDRNADELFLQNIHEECQGVVVQTPSAWEEIEAQLEQLDLPTVMTSCSDGGKRALSVCVNHEMGMRNAVALLKKYGHSRIGYVGAADKTEAEKERYRYFKLALLEEGLEFRPDLVAEANTARKDSGMQAQLEALWSGTGKQGAADEPAAAGGQDAIDEPAAAGGQGGGAPTALVLEDDLLAPEVYRALRRMGKRIPEDVSVVGFGGREICSLIDPPLSTVRVPRRFMGRMAMSMLEQRIDMRRRGLENAGVRMQIDVDVVEMESIGLAADR